MFEVDQAAGLRQLFARSRPDVILAFGGAERQSDLVATLATGMGREGSEVLVIDGTPGGMARAFGLAARYELGHVISGDKALGEVLLDAPPGVKLLPAMRGIDQLWCLSTEGGRALKREFARTLRHVEVLIVNCRPHGVTGASLAFKEGAHALLVLPDTAEALTLAYREIKALRLACGLSACDVVLGNANERLKANFVTLANTAREFLNVELILQGSLAEPERRLRALPFRPTHPRTTEPSSAALRSNQEIGHAAYR